MAESTTPQRLAGGDEGERTQAVAPLPALLDDAEALLGTIVGNTSTGYVIVDISGTIRWVSPSTSDLLGHRREVLVGRHALALVHPDDLAVATRSLDRITSGVTEGLPLVVRVRHADGGWRWVETLTRWIDDPATHGAFFSLHDVTRRVEAESQLRSSEALFRTVMQNSYDVVALVDREATIGWVTPNSVRLLGWTPEDVVGTNGLDLVHPDDLELMLKELGEFASGVGVPRPTTIKMRHKDGSWHHVELVGTDLLETPEVSAIALALRGADDRVAAEQERLRLLEVFELTGDLVGIVDANGTVAYLNRAARDFLGLEGTAPVSDAAVRVRFTETSRRRVEHEVAPALDASGAWAGELEALRADGALVPILGQVVAHRDPGGGVTYTSGVFRDISERKAMEQRLEHEATHDPLTGLPNRTLLLDRMGVALARARRRGSDVAVLFCDLDHFKVINDSLGHSAGDQVLAALSRRLEAQLRPGDTISRFGGDEFVVLCEDLEHVDDAIAIAQRVDLAVRGGVLLEGGEVHVGVSVGIALAPGGRGDPEALIRDADAAMYEAKAAGRGRYQVFAPDLWEAAVDRLTLEQALRRALDAGEFALHYQPIVDLRDGSVHAVEALLRWQHPQSGLLLPGSFLGVAEDCGLIVALGAWVLTQACGQLRAWESEVPSADLNLAVNLSGRQLAHPRLVDQLVDIIESSGVDPTHVELEITERALMDDPVHARLMLDRLCKAGVHLSVDDFGSGDSSLSHLKYLPVDGLKVNRSFVEGVDTDPNDSAIVSAVVHLAHALGLEATAEGVETESQREALVALGCDRAQGFHLGFPTGDGAELLRQIRLGAAT